jgi:hypothetical protein
VVGIFVAAGSAVSRSGFAIVYFSLLDVGWKDRFSDILWFESSRGKGVMQLPEIGRIGRKESYGGPVDIVLVPY